MTNPPIVVAVPNISEGRRAELVARIADDPLLLDVHSDPDHNRSVLTYAGPPDPLVSACLHMTRRAIEGLDIRHHEGVHPRFGVVDIVPFVPYLCTEQDAIAAARRFAEHIDATVHLYGSVDPRARSLPALRRDLAGRSGHLSAGVICVGVRRPLVAFNVNLRGTITAAREVARRLRELSSVRALAFELPSRELVQVSMNLIEPQTTGPRLAYETTLQIARGLSVAAVDAEVVGLVPDPVLHELDNLPLRAPARSIEQVLEARN